MSKISPFVSFGTPGLGIGALSVRIRSRVHASERDIVRIDVSIEQPPGQSPDLVSEVHRVHVGCFVDEFAHSLLKPHLGLGSSECAGYPHRDQRRVRVERVSDFAGYFVDLQIIAIEVPVEQPPRLRGERLRVTQFPQRWPVVMGESVLNQPVGVAHAPSAHA